MAATAVMATAMMAASPARAENTCYQYDALGRLTHTLKTSGACPTALPEPGSQPAGSTITRYTYDAAGNRTLYQVAGATGNAPTSGVVVVPLNGFTIIPLAAAY